MLLPQVRDEILSISPRELYQRTTIPAALEAVLHYAADKPQRVTVSPNLDLTKTLSGLQDYNFLAELLQDTEKWLQLFYFGMLYRTLAHVDEILSALNQRVLFRVPIATRALLELFFVLFSTYRQVYRLRQDTTALRPNECQKAINNEPAIRDLLLKQVRATRINWDSPFGDDWEQVRSEIKQTNILSMLDKL